MRDTSEVIFCGIFRYFRWLAISFEQDERDIASFQHISPVLQQLHWLPVSSRIQFKILLLTYKALNGLAPQYLADLIMFYTPGRTLRSSSQYLLHTPKWNLSTYGRRSFSSAAPVLWNALPLHIKMSPNVNNFKSQLKTYLFERAYSL